MITYINTIMTTMGRNVRRDDAPERSAPVALGSVAAAGAAVAVSARKFNKKFM
jgi:hypothetical protein